MPWLTRNSRLLGLGLVLATLLASAATVSATPNLAQLRGDAHGLLDVRPTQNPCDDVWSFLAEAGAPHDTTSAVVSIRQSYAVAGLSTLAPVRADNAGRYAMNAPMMLGSRDALGHVDVRFSRQPGPAERGYLYSVRVATCTDGGGCSDPSAHVSTPLECSIQRDSATVVVPGASARQEVRIRFSR